ncbi:MAG: hypothetical protein WC243_00295 [Patescibacteria group bacterium]|jgi:hypothetical protein
MGQFIDDPSGNLPSSMDDIYQIVLNVMFFVGLAVTLIGVIYAGIQFITSKGDPKATDKAKSALTYSVLGIVLAIGALSVKMLVLNLLGVDDPELVGPLPGI